MILPFPTCVYLGLAPVAPPTFNQGLTHLRPNCDGQFLRVPACRPTALGSYLWLQMPGSLGLRPWGQGQVRQGGVDPVSGGGTERPENRRCGGKAEFRAKTALMPARSRLSRPSR